VLEAPERDYAPEYEAPRRRAATPHRKLRRDFDEDFSDDFLDEEEGPATRRKSGLRFRGGLPRTKWGRIGAGLMVLIFLGAGAAGLVMARNALMHDPRFLISSASSIEFAGNVHATREQLLDVFGDDVERNIFYVPLAERRAELERLPWVAHATVMRLLPNRLQVSIVERTPVAFVRQGSHIGLVDANGVLLDMPPGGQGDAHYSFPVVTGISASDPLSTRAARMKLFERFTADLDGGGEKISQGLSEVDLSDPEDVRALIPTDSTDILVHFGESNFLERYKKFEQHLPEWRTLYPRLASVDMRYETQAVLDMAPESSGAQGAGSAAASGNTPGADVKASAPAATHAVLAAGHPVTTGHAPAQKRIARRALAKAVRPAKKSASARQKTPVRAVSEVAFTVPAKRHAVAHHATKTHAHGAKHSASVKKVHPSQAGHP